MKIPCISIRGAYAYWICAGIKDVENRTRLIAPGWYGVHVSGDPEEHADLLPGQFEMLQDLHAMWSGTKRTKHASRFFDESPDRVMSIKPEFANIEKWNRQRIELRRDTQARHDQQESYPTHRIIGMMHVADAIKTSRSEWSELGAVHWIIDQAFYFDASIKEVAGKLGVWYYDVDDKLVKGVLP